MRGCLDDCVCYMLIKHAAEKLLDLQRFEGALPRSVLPLLSADLKICGSHQPCAFSASLQEGADQICGGCFPISTRDTDGAEMLRGIVIKGAGEIGQGGTYIQDFDIGKRHIKCLL